MARNLLSVVVLCAASAAAPLSTPTFEQSLSAKSVSGAQISPDGRFVAYVVRQTNWEENEYTQQIWIAQTATGERYQLTSGKKSSTSPQWAPDSKRLAFVSDRNGKRQIYVISPAGGEAVQLTTEENGVESASWSPDGTAIAFTSSGPDGKEKKERKEKFGDFEIVGGDYTMSHLWLVRVPADLPADLKQLPKAEALTKGDQFSVSSFAWSPDTKRIAFSATRDPDLSSSDTEQLYVLDLADRHTRKLLDAGGPNGQPKWSPDGREIAFVTSSGNPFFYYANRRIAVMSAEGGAARVVTDSFDENANLIDWGPDGIYFGAAQKAYAHIFRVDPATRSVKRISGPEQFVLSNATFTKDHRTMAGVGGGPNQFAEVLLSGVGDFAPRVRRRPSPIGGARSRPRRSSSGTRGSSRTSRTTGASSTARARTRSSSPTTPRIVLLSQSSPSCKDTIATNAARIVPSSCC